LAKNVFQLHGTDAKNKCLLRKRLNREKLGKFMINLPACIIGIEACTGSRHWARLFKKMGHNLSLVTRAESIHAVREILMNNIEHLFNAGIHCEWSN